LATHKRATEHNTSRLKDEIAVSKGVEALFAIPFEILVTVGRNPEPIDDCYLKPS